MEGVKAIIIMLMGVVALQLHSSTAQSTSHVVLDNSGWIIPQSGGAATYTTWAASKTFMVGDTLGNSFNILLIIRLL